jgi:hypothetical protein
MNASGNVRGGEAALGLHSADMRVARVSWLAMVRLGIVVALLGVWGAPAHAIERPRPMGGGRFERGLGAGIHAGNGTGVASSLRLRANTPISGLGGYLRHAHVNPENASRYWRSFDAVIRKRSRASDAVPFLRQALC